MDPTKAAVASGVVVLAVGTGYGVSALLNNGMPDYSARQKPDPSDGKYVSNYPDYFVNADDNSNDPWWDWVYKERYSAQAQISPGKMFEGVASGSEGENSVKAKCKDAYDKENGEISIPVAEEGSKYSEVDIWRYCSAVSKKPMGISSSEKYNEGTYGKENEGKLVAINDVSNDSFWQEQQRLFFKSGEGRSGSQATEGNIFKNLWDSKKGNLKDTCKLAYETEKKTDDSAESFKKDLFKFCSLKGTES
ncbi:hypothetical protein MHSWG343_06730 [Candidatus Mycoplasma haematohominis]|uniref:Uncharacterized protein n=1 Tax=Candidatus Mycoplasma haematohominis TaxID=1494318 RepID=A0A478FQE7_9MOLU|nr:hypothetical protein MHSWG343_06730 [Candidatus Mycoplasma haemohominis]